MLITEKVTITQHIENAVTKLYRKLGYEFVLHIPFDIKIEHLDKSNRSLVDVKCDLCNKSGQIGYHSYNKNLKKNSEQYICYSCSYKRGLLANYGVKNISQTKRWKEHYKKTVSLQSDEKKKDIQSKRRKTCQIKYGVDHHMLNESVKKKIKNTCEERYNNLHYLGSEECKEKYKKWIKEEYNAEHYSKTEEFKEKIEHTFIEKYGVKTPLCDKEWMESSVLKRYGVKHNSQSKELREKRFQKYINKIKERYSDIEIKNVTREGLIEFKCTSCNKISSMNIHLFHQRYKYTERLCLICNPPFSYHSGGEDKIRKILDELEIPHSKDRKILQGEELDVFISTMNLAFEYNGVYWHSEFFKPRNYHLNKSEKCLNSGIKLIHIWEDEILYKEEIVRSRIKILLGKAERKIFARKCEIKTISSKESKEFLNKNHIQGNTLSSTNIGLFYKKELVSVMTFGKLRKNLGYNNEKDSYELLRFCSILNTVVVGGAQKMFKYFIEEKRPKRIISYAKRDWSSNPESTVYTKLGFKFKYFTSPGYQWVVNTRRENRFNFRKDILVRMGFDKDKSESEIMHERGYYRTFDSGNLFFEWTEELT